MGLRGGALNSGISQGTDAVAGTMRDLLVTSIGDGCDDGFRSWIVTKNSGFATDWHYQEMGCACKTSSLHPVEGILIASC